MRIRNDEKKEEVQGIKWDALSLDLKICYWVYDFNKKKEKVWFGKLIKPLKGEAGLIPMGKAVEKLLDLGILDGHWEKIGDKWARVLMVTGEAESFVKNIYRNINKVKQ